MLDHPEIIHEVNTYKVIKRLHPLNSLWLQAVIIKYINNNMVWLTKYNMIYLKQWTFKAGLLASKEVRRFRSSHSLILPVKEYQVMI